MAVVQIDETELASLRGSTNALAALLNNPASRRKVLEAQKIVKPDANIPELDATQPLLDAISGLASKVEDIDKKLKTDAEARADAEAKGRLRSQWDSGRGKLREQGYTAEGITKIEEIMEKHGIADHEVAAAYHDRLNPPPSPVVGGSKSFDIFSAEAKKDDNMKLLFEGGEEQFLTTTINNTLRDIRGR